MPKLVDHAARRAEISHVIRLTIAKHGLERLTVRAIAKEGGFSSGVLAHYFSNKEEMINVAFSAVADEVFARIDAKIATSTSSLNKLRIIIEEHLPDSADNAMAAVTLAFWGSAIHNHFLAECFVVYYRRWRTYLHFCIREGIARHEIVPLISIEDEVDLIIAMTDGLLLSLSLDPDHFRSERRDRLIDAIFSRLATSAVPVAARGYTALVAN